MICTECGKEFTDTDGACIDEEQGFYACGPCTEEVNAQWEETKMILRAEGMDPDACCFK